MEINNNDLILLGDTHGAWSQLMWNIERADIRDKNILGVGDLGVGFYANPAREKDDYKSINRALADRNIFFYGIRGNHDDPNYFKKGQCIELSNFQTLEDYTQLEWRDKIKILCVGGAVSIDRTGRLLNKSYWEDEAVNYQPSSCREVDVLVTHTAPSWCFPQQFNEMVYGWALEDAYLIGDLSNERAIMNEIHKLCKPKLHFYGHFHSSWTETINNCKHKLLNIDELYQLVI
jgi:hypothetical protein